MQSISSSQARIKGRFAPSPSGRMHLGNIYTALLSWLSVKARKGTWLLRIEDLDTQRSRPEYAKLIEDDLLWLGLEWDEGGLDNIGTAAPYSQSLRTEIYEHYINKLAPLTYPCFCRRADILATQAPHQSDGRIIYAGTCRPAQFPAAPTTRPHSVRILVPNEDITFTDAVYGVQQINLATQCGDFIIRRADGAFAYQLAVVVDDALMGVTEVMRGSDLLLSAAQQIFLYRALGFTPPRFAHLPLLYSDTTGRRLSKRDQSLSMEHLRQHFQPEEIIGQIAYIAGIRPDNTPLSAKQLLQDFSLDAIPKTESIPVPEYL